MFISSSIFSGLELWSVNYKLKSFKNIKILGEISNNWPNYLLGTNAYRALESYLMFADNITMD